MTPQARKTQLAELDALVTTLETGVDDMEVQLLAALTIPRKA